MKVLCKLYGCKIKRVVFFVFVFIRGVGFYFLKDSKNFRGYGFENNFEGRDEVREKWNER